MEMLPGLMTWTIILGPFLLAAFAPKALAYFILIYFAYLVYQALSFGIFSIAGFFRSKKHDKIIWFNLLKNDFPKKWKKYYFATLIPFAGETKEILIPTIESLVSNNYPKERKLLVLSSEAKLPKGKKIAEALAEQFKHNFAKIVVTEHKLKAGEIVGKSSNENWAGRVLDRKCKDWKLAPENVVVCSNDADISIHPEYMANAIYLILKQDDYKHTTIVQSMLADYKNIWLTDPINRLRAVFTAFWHLATPYIMEKAYVFAHYSMTLRTLKDIGFWDPDIIHEDNRTYSKALFSLGTKFNLVHSFLLVEGETVRHENFLESMKLSFKQARRWSWGASEVAYIVKEGLLRKNKAPKWRILMYFYTYLTMHIQWVIASYVPGVATLILFMLNPGLKNQTLTRNMSGLFQSVIPATNIFMLFFFYAERDMIGNPPYKKNKFLANLIMFTKWIFSPLTGILLSSLPALESQTRLIFNKRLQYEVYRKDSSNV